MAGPQGGKPAPIVADLGRPETPQEVADRKAESSRRHRQSQTLRNLILALVACLAVVLFLVLVIVRPDPPPTDLIDYHAVAADAQKTVTQPLVDPQLPPEWKANEAEIRKSSDDITSWYIGFITPSQQFIAVNEGIAANETWVSNQLEGKRSTGTVVVGSRTWTVYDYRDSKDPGNLAYAMVTEVTDAAEPAWYVLYGTADSNEFATAATSITTELPEESAQ